MNPHDIMELLHVGVGLLTAVLGLSIMIAGAVGVLRFPDVYTRAHAGNAANGVGAALVFLGLAVIAWDWAISARLGVLALLASCVGPLITHFAAAAAHAAGMAPVVKGGVKS